MLLMFLSVSALAQQYMTKEGNVHFFSEAPMENIEAVNEKVAAIIDAETEEFAFKVLMEEFQFEKSLMQEHFNENYLESDQYPFATFTGAVKGFQQLDLSSKQEVEVKGEMNLHGIKKSIKVKAKVWVEEGQLQISAVFMVKLADYNIDIPKIVMYKIAEEIAVTVNMQLSAIR